MKQVTIYTDGACVGNPGRGGFGAVLLYNGHSKDLSGGFRRTTNNRMELFAVIAGLEAIKEPCRVTVISDARYVVDAVNKGWARRWKERGWRRNRKANVINPDLWDRLLGLLDFHDAEFQWVKGHSGNEGNERADSLAVAACGPGDLPTDTGYETPVDYTAPFRLC